MYISLYSQKQLHKLKRNVLLLGLFLTAGGSVSLFREVVFTGAMRPEWLAAAALLVVAGGIGIAIANDVIRLKDAYFSMNPSRLAFRLTLFGREYQLLWTQIRAVRTTDESIVFELRNEKELVILLSTIPDSKVARHIQASISLAAMEQNIKINGVLAKHKHTAA